MRRSVPIFIALWMFSVSMAAMPKQQLADSLDCWSGFQLGCVPKVKVTQIKTNGSYIWVYTNKTLGGLSLSEADIRDLRKRISLWLRGDVQGKVSIYSDDVELGELVTSRFRARKLADTYSIPCEQAMGAGLRGQSIALWPSHGIYYNQDEDRYKPQRATMWTTVEDVYTTAYAELVSQCLERAGATVYWPRARYGKDAAATEPGNSGYPRWTECAREWLAYTGVPDSIWLPHPQGDENPLYFSNDSVHKDYLDDLRCRGLWVNWLHQQHPLTLALALHTDGYSQVGDSTTIGTLAIYSQQDRFHQMVFPDGTSRIVNRDVADYIQTQVVEDIRATACPNWSRRQLFNAGYCETKYPVVPSVLLEMLSHKQLADIQYGLDPAFRKTVARAIYKGIGRWIHSLDGQPFVVQPLPVHAIAITADRNNHLDLHWCSTIDSLEPTATPHSFLVQMRANDGAWQTVDSLSDTTYHFNPQAGIRYDFRVIAANAGGYSEPSEVLSAYLALSPTIYAQWALIINGFNSVRGPQWFADSTYAGIVPHSYSIPDGEDGIYIGEQWDYDRSHEWISDDDCGWGMCYRDQLGLRQVGNTHDYAARHGRVLADLGISYISANSEAINTIDSSFIFVDVVWGKERRAVPKYVAEFAARGGHILISGAYLGTVPRAGQAGKIQMGNQTYTFATRPNAERICAEDCNAFAPNKKQQVRARYSDSGTPACVQEGHTILWSVPLESFNNFETLLKHLYEEITSNIRTH